MTDKQILELINASTSYEELLVNMHNALKGRTRRCGRNFTRWSSTSEKEESFLLNHSYRSVFYGNNPIKAFLRQSA